MKRKRFTDQEKQELFKNPNILKVGESNATYCPKFKIQAIKEYESGKSPTMIFNEAGINLEILGKSQPGKCLNRWCKIWREKGKEFLLKEARGLAKASGRPWTKPLTSEEELKQLRAQNVLLKAENDFLKKLDLIERGLM